MSIFTRIKPYLFAGLAITLLGLFLYFISNQPIKSGSVFKPVPTRQDEVPTIPNEKSNFDLEISKIGVKAVITPDVDGADEKIVDKVLRYSVAHLKGSSYPGGGSNIYLFGHSSSVHGTAKYDTIFARLGELSKGDVIVVKFHGGTYKYNVSQTLVVEPDNVSVARPTQFEQLTIQTSWPLGTVRQRLIVKAKPIN